MEVSLQISMHEEDKHLQSSAGFVSLFFQYLSVTNLPVLVMTISVPLLWNCSHSSLCSRVTFGSSCTLSSSGAAAAGGRNPGKPPNGRRGKWPG